MDIQQLAKDIGPWLALVGSVIAVIGGIGRYRTAPRLRANIAKDIELLEKAPESAKGSLTEAIEHQSNKLRDRVVEGWRPGPAMSVVVVSLLTIVLSSFLLYVGHNPEFGPGEPTPSWLNAMMKVMGTIGVSAGVLFISLVGLVEFFDWLSPGGPSLRAALNKLVERLRAVLPKRSAKVDQDASAS